MKNSRIALAFISVTTLCASVHAQAQKNDSVYGEVGYLMAKHKVNVFDDDVAGISLTLGKELGPNLAAEIMYAPGTNTRTGTATSNGTRLNYDMKLKSIYGIYLKPRLMVTNDLEFFGKLGYANVSRNVNAVNASNPADKASKSDSGSDVSYGFGFKYHLTPAFSLMSDYTSYYNKSSIKINGYTVGVGYRF